MNKLVYSIIAFTVLISTVQAEFFGGIPAPADKPPLGTVIDQNLTNYYGVPTAIGNGTYWHIGGWGWFNETEMLGLPSASHMYDISPYDCVSSGCGGGSTRGITEIPIPISPWVLVSFIIFAVFVVWRVRR